MTATLRPFLLMVSLALGVMQIAAAAVPNTLTYQGTLTDEAGPPVSGSKSLTLASTRSHRRARRSGPRPRP
jgi:hypothetical protein